MTHSSERTVQFPGSEGRVQRPPATVAVGPTPVATSEEKPKPGRLNLAARQRPVRA
jgi:hypothetical protein